MSTTQEKVTVEKKKAPPKPKPPTKAQIVDERLSRMEAAIERMAAALPAPAIPSQQESIQHRPSRADLLSPLRTGRSASLDNIDRRGFTQDFQSILSETRQVAQNSQRETPSNCEQRQPLRQAEEAARRPTDPTSAWNVNNDTRPRVTSETDKHKHWEGWLHDHNTRGTALRPTPLAGTVPPMNLDQASVENQVQQILASTASSLSRGTLKAYDFPYKYLSRGPEKKKLTLNQVTLAEHLWGILRMAKDPKLDPALVKPLLLHLEDVIEDSCEFEWGRVRRWSEAIFCLVTEDRLPYGWASGQRIQMLRMNMSRVESALLQHHREQPYRRQQSLPSHQQQTDFTKGGPPCQPYNSPAGCPYPAGHLYNGRRMAHVCSFCLMNSSAAYTHPETQCRNKTRYPPPHF